MTEQDFEDFAKRWPDLFQKSGDFELSVHHGWSNIIDMLFAFISSDVERAKTRLKFALENPDKKMTQTIEDLETTVQQALEDLPVIVQVKEKFGGLRFYIDGGNLKSIGNILCIVGIILAFSACVYPWYAVETNITVEGYETHGMANMLTVDGLDGIIVQVPGLSGPLRRPSARGQRRPRDHPVHLADTRRRAFSRSAGDLRLRNDGLCGNAFERHRSRPRRAGGTRPCSHRYR